VFNVQSQMLEHTESISHVVPLRNERFASLSGKPEKQTLIVSDADGNVVARSSHQGVIGIGENDKALLLAKTDGTITDAGNQNIDIGLSEKQVAFSFGERNFAVGFECDSDGKLDGGEVNLINL
jgi:hypothetical protein